TGNHRNPESGLHQLTFTSGKVVAGFVWSPDGKRIAYNRSSANPAVIEVDKPWTEKVPDEVPKSDVLKGTLWGHSWSSDGKMLAGDEEHEGDMDVAGSIPVSRFFLSITWQHRQKNLRSSAALMHKS